MRRYLIAILAFPCLLSAAEPGAYVAEPNLVGQITSVLTASRIDYLTPHKYEDNGKRFSYHLKSVSYLGTIEHGSERFLLATALFLRSSAQGSEYPPARGHGFLLCLSEDIRLISHCRLDLPEGVVSLTGTQLMRDKVIIGDLSASDEATKQNGYLIDGSDFLSYPYTDRRTKPSASSVNKP